QVGGDVGDVRDRILVQVGPVVLEVENVGTGARLDGSRDTRLEVVGVDGLEHALCAQRLGGLGHLALQLDVRFGDEVHPAHPVQLGALGEGRRAPRGEDALYAPEHTGGDAR